MKGWRICVVLLLTTFLKPCSGCSGRLLNVVIQTAKDVIGEFEDGMSHKSIKNLLSHDDEGNRIREWIEAKILPLDQIYQPHPTLGSDLVNIYTDITGCYETGTCAQVPLSKERFLDSIIGHSRDYRGRMSVTMTFRRCAPWINLSWNLHETINDLSKRIDITTPATVKDRKRRKKYQRRIQRLNDTIQMLLNEDENYELTRSQPIERDIVCEWVQGLVVGFSNYSRHECFNDHGYILHNFCRDPDNIGRPWCVVKTIDGLEWERCPVPFCTPCWRVRQNGIRHIFASYGLQNWTQTAWLPTCTSDGKFNHTQFWEDYCWCSTEKGRIIRGTMVKKDANGCNQCEQFNNPPAT